MSRFLKIEGESVWVNVERVDGIFVRPQLAPVSPNSAASSLEEVHQATGLYEMGVMFQGQIGPVKTFPSRAEAEQFVETLLAQLG